MRTEALPSKLKELREILTADGISTLSKGHPWIRAGHFKNVEILPRSAYVLTLGEHWFMHSPMSRIRLRRLGPTDRMWMRDSELFQIANESEFQNVFGEWLISHLESLWMEKRRLLGLLEMGEPFRWVFAEADHLPGWIVDVYDTKIVCQILTAPAEKLHASFCARLKKVAERNSGHAMELVLLRNSVVRAKEGLEVEKIPDSLGEDSQKIRWNGLTWNLASQGHKTGMYLDQRLAHVRVAEWARTLGLKSAADVFCYQGGFGLHLGHMGLRVHAVDASEAALLKLKENWQGNELPEQHLQTSRADAFSWLRSCGENFDLVVLDPPKLAGSREQLPGALRGLRDLQIQALKIIHPGGLLVSCVCSQLLSREVFLEILRESAHSVRRRVQILEIIGPSPDHTELLSFPESAYLHSWILRVF